MALVLRLFLSLIVTGLACLVCLGFMHAPLLGQPDYRAVLMLFGLLLISAGGGGICELWWRRFFLKD